MPLIIFNLYQEEKWDELVKLASSHENLPQNDLFIYLNPTPKIISSLSIALLIEAAYYSKLKVEKHIKPILPVLVNNLSSQNKTLTHYSISLLDACAPQFSESSIFELVNFGLFQALLQVKYENCIRLAHKVFHKREKIQRVFLKCMGYKLIILSLKVYEDESKGILAAAFDLMMVIFK